MGTLRVYGKLGSSEQVVWEHNTNTGDTWDGMQIKGTFSTEDLQKVTVEDDDLFRIDKIVKRKGNKVLVRWKGWPDKYDTWLNKKDVSKS